MPSEYDISRAFKRIEDDLMESMMRNLKRHQVEEKELGMTWEQWQAIQLRELEEYRLRNADKFTDDFKSIDRKVDELYRETAKNAQAKEEASILDKIKKRQFTPDKDKGGFFRLNEGKLEALIMATKSDFARAEFALLRRANDQYRKIIFDSMVYANVTNDYKKAVDMATHDFLRAGINCVVYKNGARHTIADYASMALRTGNKRAYLMGEGNAHAKYGLHIVRVNNRTNACPLCVGFLGKLLIDDVYAGGTQAEADQMGIPTLSDAMLSGFLHPNCKDMYSVYVPGVSKGAKPWSAEEIEQITEDYNTEQKIKYAQDTADTYARMAKYSLDPDNQAKYEAKAQEWQAKADELKGNKPKPIEPATPTEPTAQPVAPAKPSTEPPTDVAEGTAEPISRIDEVKQTLEDLDKAKQERKELDRAFDTYQNDKGFATITGGDVADELRSSLENAKEQYERTPNEVTKRNVDRYQYILDHLEEFENGTYADEVDKVIAELEQKEQGYRADAFEVLRNKVGFSVNETEFADMPTLLLVENSEQLAKLEARYGMVGKSFRPSIEYKTGGGNTNAMVSHIIVSPESQWLTLYESHYGDTATLRASRARCLASRWSMPCLESEFDVYTVTHEYGHMVHNIFLSQDMDSFATFKTRATTYAGRQKAYERLAEKTLDRYRTEIIDIAKTLDPNFDITKELSRYGMKSPAEFFAEVFANSQLGAPNTLGRAMTIWLKGRGYA